MRLRRRALSIATLVFGGCAQTDLVAHFVDARTDAELVALDGGQDAETRDSNIDASTDQDAKCDDSSCAEPACPARSCTSLSTLAALCASTSAPIISGDSCDTTLETAPSFHYALCSCSDLTAARALTVNAFSSTLTSQAPGRAALGVNGNLTLAQPSTVDGVVRVAGSVAGQGSLQVERVSSPPCACAPEQQFDVRTVVAARKSDHDNARVNLATSALDNPLGSPILDLPCGRYFFTRIASTRPITIQTHGNVALFVEGNIELDDSLQIQAQDSGQVSLFVAGELRVAGAFSLGGDPSGPGRASLYAGGQGTLAFRGSAAIVGNIVAPNAELVNEGILELYGSALVRRAAPIGDVVIHYDTSAATSVRCTP